METRKYLRIMSALSLMGLLFSLYLSGVKLITSTCAFNEPCPYFLGYPACWFGFGIFLIIFISSVLGLNEKITPISMTKINGIMSSLGILFAGYFTIPEIKKLIVGTETGYSLGLPTCAYGLVFFILICSFALAYFRKNKTTNY